MKVVIVNGSPRKEWNTAQILKEAERGAREAGHDTEYIDLYDLAYNGCRSCLACKRKGVQEPGKCWWPDELYAVLEKVRKADRLITGSPIYYGEPTGGFRSFFERLVFPAMSYNDHSSVLQGKVDTDVFLTMNVSEEMYGEYYAEKMKGYFSPMRYLNGTVSIHPVCDTLQVEDYSKYDMDCFSEEHKKQVHAEQFSEDLRKAYRIGAGVQE